MSKIINFHFSNLPKSNQSGLTVLPAVKIPSHPQSFRYNFLPIYQPTGKKDLRLFSAVKSMAANAAIVSYTEPAPSLAAAGC